MLQGNRWRGVFIGAFTIGLAAALGAEAQERSGEAPGNRGAAPGQAQQAEVPVLSLDNLADEVAQATRLSKADAKRALDAFISSTTKAVDSGGAVWAWGTSRAETDGGGAFFGVFSAVRGGASADGCPLENQVVFDAGPAFLDAEGGREADRCEAPVPGAGDEEIIRGMVELTRLPAETAANAYFATLEIIAAVVNEGGIVDLEGFGRFEAETTVTATVTDPCAGVPENCPPASDGHPILAVDVWEVSVSTSGASQADIDALTRQVETLAKRKARTGRNPQTGKEIQIAAKNVVKFKAGAELSKGVN